MKRVAIYARVSTADQNYEGQIDELLALCERANWQVIEIYREKISGTKGANDRPELKRLLKDARQRRFDQVAVWSTDRLGRSMRHLVAVLNELKDINVGIYSHQQGLDTATPMGAMLFQFLGIFSEWEWEIRKERQALGIRRAKDRGVHFGRKPTPQDKIAEIIRMRQEGASIAAVCSTLKVSPNTVYKVMDAS